MISKERLQRKLELAIDAREGYEQDGCLRMYELWDEDVQIYTELLDRRERDAFPDNQRLCIGFDSGCDGNLEGVEHIESCPAYAADRKLRSYLYAPEADNEVR